jgi:hypothetical protein
VSPYRGFPFLADPRHADLTAAAAVLLHGLIAVVVLAPILRIVRHPWQWTAVAFVAGPAVDLDHVFAAGSASPRAMEQLGDRPETHTILLGVALALLVLLISRNLLVAWAVFTIDASHVIFDAAGGADRWLYPISTSASLPWLICPATIALFYAISWLLASRAARSDVPTATLEPSPPASSLENASRGSVLRAILRRPQRQATGRTGARRATASQAVDPLE